MLKVKAKKEILNHFEKWRIWKLIPDLSRTKYFASYFLISFDFNSEMRRKLHLLHSSTLTQLWPFSKSKFNLKSGRVNLVSLAGPIECLLYLTTRPGDTVQNGSGKVDPARKFKCTTAACGYISEIQNIFLIFSIALE